MITGTEDQAERLSAMLAEAIRHTAHVAGEIDTYALHTHLMGWAGVPEEQCGGDIIATMFFMTRCGLYTSNTPDTLGGETRLKASRMLTTHLYDDRSGADEEDLT